MRSEIEALCQQGDRLFSGRQALMGLWQEIADHFYPERADFTASRSWGQDFASHLTTSYPVQVRRDLSAAFSTMLRRGDWFGMTTEHQESEDHAAKQWLESRTRIQRRAMYDTRSQFVRSMKEGDEDYASFGQCVLSASLNRNANGLLYNNYHLRDVAWRENTDRVIADTHRNWGGPLRELDRMFRGNIAPKLQHELAHTKDPYREVPCRHVIIPSEDWDTGSGPGGKRWKTPYVSIHYDVENRFVMEEIGMWDPFYIIPRWKTLPGSPYAYSPATSVGLADARLLQSMTLVLLEAGEKAVDPPMMAREEVVRNMELWAGGISWLDAEYDEKMGPALKQVMDNASGIPLGFEMQEMVRKTLADIFYLSKISLPELTRQMTAYETGKRVEEYIRNLLPLFEPVESDYNGQVCERTFDILLRAGGFGPREDIPRSLRGANIQFRFESPIREAEDRKKLQTFMETRAVLAEAEALEPGTARMLKVPVATRDVLDGNRTPAAWLLSEDEMAEAMAQAAADRQANALLASMQAGAGVAEQVGKAGQALNAAQ